MSSTEMVVLPREDALVKVDDFMPLLSVEQAVQRKGMINQFIGQVLVEDLDYGDIPGAAKKKVLLKPGAEKLCSIFGLAPQYIKETVIEDWTGEEHGGEPLFYYEYRCQLSRGGRFMGEAIGSCNSWESKYRYRWVTKENTGAHDPDDLPVKGGKRTLFEPEFALNKRETGGQYGKPLEHWALFDVEMEANRSRRVEKKTKAGKPMWGIEIDVDQTLYRIPNPDVADIINTCQKMAQKRSLVAAVLVVTNCSDAFTQDIEDFQEPHSNGETAPAHARTPGETPSNVPPEIEALFLKDIPAGATGKAFELVRRALAEAFPQNGSEEYHRILERNEIKAKGGNTIGQVRNAVMQGWTLAQSALKLKVKAADLEVMSDMPAGQGRDPEAKE